MLRFEVGELSLDPVEESRQKIRRLREAAIERKVRRGEGVTALEIVQRQLSHGGSGEWNAMSTLERQTLMAKKCNQALARSPIPPHRVQVHEDLDDDVGCLTPDALFSNKQGDTTKSGEASLSGLALKEKIDLATWRFRRGENEEAIRILDICDAEIGNGLSTPGDESEATEMVSLCTGS